MERSRTKLRFTWGETVITYLVRAKVLSGSRLTYMRPVKP